MAERCGWCGHPRCEGTTPVYPHHSLCCLDGPPRPCWRSGDQVVGGPIVGDDHGTTTEADAAAHARATDDAWPPTPEELRRPTRSEAEADERH